MKTIVFAIFLWVAGNSIAQPFVNLTFTVRDELTEKKLDSAFIHVYRENGEELDKDSSGFFFGHFKSFWLEAGQIYKFVISKEGYVSKMGEVDARFDKKNDSLKYDYEFPCFVSLFPECEAADYSFLADTPLIKLYLNDEGKMDWDREYVREMQLKISEAAYANISPEEKDQYIKLYYDGQSLIEFQMYDSAMVKLLAAKEIVDCYRVNNAITECLEREDGLYNADTLRIRYQRLVGKKDYVGAIALYNKWRDHLGNNSIDIEVQQSVQYYRVLVKADEFYKEENYEDARYYYKRASKLNPKDKYPIERLEELDVLLNKK